MQIYQVLFGVLTEKSEIIRVAVTCKAVIGVSRLTASQKQTVIDRRFFPSHIIVPSSHCAIIHRLSPKTAFIIFHISLELLWTSPGPPKMSGPSFDAPIDGQNVLAGISVLDGGTFNAHFNHVNKGHLYDANASNLPSLDLVKQHLLLEEKEGVFPAR
jgi:hypothetical protein